MLKDTEHWISEGEAVEEIFRTKNILVPVYGGPTGSWEVGKGVISNTNQRFS